MDLVDLITLQLSGVELNLANKNVLIYSCLPIATIGIIIGWLIRKHKVNCWFCGVDSHVGRKEIRWWFCTNCQQYNGFAEDGDYFKEISAMYGEPSNKLLFCRYGNESPLKVEDKHTLCEACQLNQKRKIEEHKTFVATNEAYYEMECEDYERYLNKKYAPCDSCTCVIFYKTQEQDQQIKEMYSEEWDSLKPKLLRKLKQANNGRCSFCYYWIQFAMSIIAPVVLLAIPLVLKKLLQQDILYDNQILLICACSLLALIFSTMMLNGQGNVSWLQSLLMFRWLALMFLFKSEWTDYVPFTLDVLLVLEIVNLLARFYQYLRQKWRRKRYLSERKCKITSIAPTCRKIRKVPLMNNETEEIIDNKKASVLHQLHAPVVNRSSIQSEFSPNNQAQGHRSIVTPDLLQGHLNSMFIGKKDFVDNVTNKVRSNVNHVVAALKYRSSPMSMVKQPLLKPATLTLSQMTALESVSQTKHVCEQELNKDVNNGKFKMFNAPRNIPLSSSPSKDSDHIDRKKTNKNANTVIPLFISWKVIVALVFVISLFFNVGFIMFYFLYSTEK